MLLYILIIWHTVLDHRTGDKVLQFVLVSLIESFELVIYVYDKVLTDISECVFLLRIYFSCVTVTMQCWGTEQVKERGLELSLLTCQHEAGKRKCEPMMQIALFLILPDTSLLFSAALRGARTPLSLPMETGKI